jgi:hypothetical protein
VAAVQSQLNQLQAFTGIESTISTQRALVTASLTGDVAWPDLVKKINASLPDDVWLSSFSGAAAKGTTAANFKVTAHGLNHNAVAHWLQEIEKLPEVADLWVNTATKEPGNGPVTFESTAALTPAAGSDRAARLAEETK